MQVPVDFLHWSLAFRPVYAVAIPIIAHIWAKFFGTLGTGWFATLQVVDLDEAAITAAAYQSGLLIIIQAVLGGLTIVWLYGRWPAIRHAWPLVLIIAAIQALHRGLHSTRATAGSAEVNACGETRRR